MADSNVETVREAYGAWNRRDESFLEFLDPAVEWIPAAQFIEGALRGRDDVRRLLESFEQAFEEIRWEPVRIEAGAEAGEVVVEIDTVSRGRGSGVEVTVRVAHLLRLRDGKVVWGKVYPNAKEGLAAAGVAGDLAT